MYLQVDELKETLLPFFKAVYVLFHNYPMNSFLHSTFEATMNFVFKIGQEKNSQGIGIKNLNQFRIEVLKISNILENIPKDTDERLTFEFDS